MVSTVSKNGLERAFAAMCKHSTGDRREPVECLHMGANERSRTFLRTSGQNSGYMFVLRAAFGGAVGLIVELREFYRVATEGSKRGSKKNCEPHIFSHLCHWG